MTLLNDAHQAKHDVRIAVVTPDQARLWLSSRPYRGQRPLRPAHVQFLAEEMRRGRFRPTAEVVFAVEEKNRYFLINGNHTLNAIVMCDKPQTVTLFHYASQDSNDTAEAYGSIDTNLARSVSDLFSAMYLKDELGFTATQLNRVGGGVKFIEFKFSQTAGRLHHDDYIRLIRQYAKHGHDYYSVLAGAPQSISAAATRAATMGMALVTFRFASQSFGEDKIVDFWNGVIFDDAIKSNDPRKVANRHLELTGTIGGGHRKTGKGVRVVSQAYSARYLANCFNAFVEGRNITSTSVTDSSAPIKIVGTPFTGNQ